MDTSETPESEPDSPSGDGSGDGSSERGWLTRHRTPILVGIVSAVLLALVGSWLVYLDNQISQVPRVELDLDENRRPERVTGPAEESVNILLAGADAGKGPSIEKAMSDGEWNPYSHRSDTIMVLHLTADRERAYLISVPRDTWTEVEGLGKTKINAAFASGGPSRFVQTLEEFTGLRMDHVAIIDWAGFKELTKAIGGVPIKIPKDIYDPSQDVQWTAGEENLEGLRALQYVRMRYGLEEGDFDRIKRQQNFLRAFLRKMLSNGTTSNPIALTNSVEAIVKYLTVDDEFTNDKMRSLALSLRSLEEEDVTFITVPKKRYARIDGQSVVIADQKKTKALFEAVANDDMAGYLDRYGRSDVLGKQKNIS